MPRNVEIKARVAAPAQVETRVQRLGARGPTEIAQEDTFFNVPDGRLKLRRFADRRGELIFYKRPDLAGPKQSDYVLYETSAPERLAWILEAAFGVRGTVRKRRRLYLLGQTRIHLDQVEDLGAFLELEVVLAEGQPVAEGTEIAQQLAQALRVDTGDLVDAAYIDLLLKIPEL